MLICDINIAYKYTIYKIEGRTLVNTLRFPFQKRGVVFTMNIECEYNLKETIKQDRRIYLFRLLQQLPGICLNE